MPRCSIKDETNITKAKWVPRTDNPSGIGSSLAFGATQAITPEPVLVEEERERNAELQHDIHVFGHKETETATASLRIETIQNQGEAIPIQEETHDAQEEVVPVRSEAVPTIILGEMLTGAPGALVKDTKKGNYIVIIALKTV